MYCLHPLAEVCSVNHFQIFFFSIAIIFKASKDFEKEIQTEPNSKGLSTPCSEKLFIKQIPPRKRRQLLNIFQHNRRPY